MLLTHTISSNVPATTLILSVPHQRGSMSHRKMLYHISPEVAHLVSSFLPLISVSPLSVLHEESHVPQECHTITPKWPINHLTPEIIFSPVFIPPPLFFVYSARTYSFPLLNLPQFSSPSMFFAKGPSPT